ncbi:hypothetical protein FRC17_007615 [Serendipita sp. 399]|nr:hypothetical protein FRC17_007615 [Serendipita sp. 399]
MGLFSAGLTALYARDPSYLSSLQNLPLVPRLSHARTFASGRSVFFGFICLIVILILAYVTNPSEASFRTFLTEQVFRRHLQRLHIEQADENTDIESLNNKSSLTRISDGEGRLYALPSHKALTGSNYGHNPRNQVNKPPRFHFTNRSAVSLQTPAHVYRSYGICTIAVTQDIDTASPFVSRQTCPSDSRTMETSLPMRQVKIRGTWFIGAFGKWWVGGELEISKEDLLAIAVNGNSTVSNQEQQKAQGELKDGRYEIKVLDQSDAFEGKAINGMNKLNLINEIGLSLSGSTLVNASTPTSQLINAPNGTGKKTRSRASTRSIKQTVTPTSSRDSSPAPLGAPGIQSSPVKLSAPPIAPAVNRSSRSNSNANSPAIESDPRHPPDVTKITQEITKSQAAVQELRDQLSSFQSSAFASQAALRLTLEDHRTRKRQEDAMRVELKGRTKVLEESKRNADTRKREADKKLKIAQTAQDSTINRTHRLRTEIEAMKKRMVVGEDRLQRSEDDANKTEAQIQDDMERQKVASKILEDNINALTNQAKQLEETLGQERERLVQLKDECEKLKQIQQKQQQEAALLALQAHQNTIQGLNTYGSMENIGLGGVDPQAQSNSTWNGFNPLQAYTHATYPGHSSVFNPFDQLVTPAQPLRRPSDEMGVLIQEPAVTSSSRFRSLSLGELSTASVPFPTFSPPKDAPTTSHSGFSPFDVDDRNRVTSLPGNSSFSSLSSAVAGLLPANLVDSMETESPVSLIEPPAKLESRNSSESRWRSSIWPFKSETLSKSTAAPAVGSSKRDFDPFDAPKHTSGVADGTSSVPDVIKPSPSVTRKWFSKSATVSLVNPLDPPTQVISAPEAASLASKSRLNPDAKVFSLPKGRSLLSTSLWTQGAGMAMPPPLNVRPTGLHLIPALDDPSSLSSTGSLPLSTAGLTDPMIAKATPATKPRFRSLFSSPFAPSPAEREALQRALEKNLSHDRISVASDGSAEGRMPPSPFGLPPPGASLFDVDEEEGDSGWGSVLKSLSEKKKKNLSASIGHSLDPNTLVELMSSPAADAAAKIELQDKKEEEDAATTQTSSAKPEDLAVPSSETKGDASSASETIAGAPPANNDQTTKDSAAGSGNEKADASEKVNPSPAPAAPVDKQAGTQNSKPAASTHSKSSSLTKSLLNGKVFSKKMNGDPSKRQSPVTGGAAKGAGTGAELSEPKTKKKKKSRGTLWRFFNSCFTPSISQTFQEEPAGKSSVPSTPLKDKKIATASDVKEKPDVVHSKDLSASTAVAVPAKEPTPSRRSSTAAAIPTNDAELVVPPATELLPLTETEGVTSGAVQAPGSTGVENDESEAGATDDERHRPMEDEDDEERLILNGGNGIPIGPDGKEAPLLPPLSKENKGRKCLVLDLDETLVHSSFKLIPSADYVVPVEIEWNWHNVYVIKRPGVDAFLKRMGELYEIVVFTASLSKYADPVLDKLDVHKVVSHRLFRESCYLHKGNYVKDLSQLGRPIGDTIILDNSPASYIFHPNNAVPVSSWFNDPHDTELTDMAPFLADLAEVADIRSVLDGGI